MCQWASKYDLAGTQPVVGENKSITYANEGKRITRYPDGTLLLDVTTSTEYGHPRQDGEAWPHLLIQQDFKVLPNIGNLEKLHFNMELKLDKCENKMGMGEYNESFHTAQSPFYLIVRNSNPDSEDNGLSIWFGIPCYDYRYPKMTDQEVIQWDLGTSMYIYSVAQVPIWGDIDFNDMKWHRAEGDILPMIKKAVTDMHSKGLFLNTELSDLELTGMNFGWEIPGTFDAALLVKNISLKAVEKEYGK